MELLLFISVQFWSTDVFFTFFSFNCLQVDKVGESAAEVGFVESFREAHYLKINRRAPSECLSSCVIQ